MDSRAANTSRAAVLHTPEIFQDSYIKEQAPVRRLLTQSESNATV